MPRIEAIEYAVGMIAMHPGDLDESGRVRIELFPSGEYVHPKGGKLQIDEEVLGRFKADLDARADRIPLDYDHAFAKGHPKGSLAAGWFVPGTAEIAPGKDGKASLWAAVQLTPRAAQEVRDGEYRFISPEWNFEWRDSTGKKRTDPRVYAAALTNRPFFEGMSPVNLCDEGIEALIASHPDPAGEPGTTKEEATMSLTAIAESLGLAADASEDEVLAAVKAAQEEKSQLAAEKDELAKKVPADEVLAGLVASAAKGEEAAKRLDELERDTVIAEAVRERKIDPAEKESLEALWAASPDGVKALLAAKTAGSFAPKGSEGTLPEGQRTVTAEGGSHDALYGSTPPETVLIQGTDVAVDPDSVKVHTKALELLAAEGKGLSYTADEYVAACTAAAAQVGVSLH